MGLETVTHISDLDPANPDADDPKSQGDNHLRNIKTALKTDLPNITGPVTATQAELNVLAGVSSNGFIARTGSGTGAARTLVAGAGIDITNPTGAGGDPTISVTASAGLGDVNGPGSSTDNALVRFDSTTGKLIQNSTATLSDDGDLTAASYHGGQLAGMRNCIINGAMLIWQRGTNISTGTGDTFGPDRWFTNFSGSDSVRQLRQSTDAPTGFKFSVDAWRVTSLGAESRIVSTRIESKDAYQYAGNTVTVSWWAKLGTGTGTTGCTINLPGAEDNFSSTTLTHNFSSVGTANTTWQKFSVSFVLDAGAVNGFQITINVGGGATGACKFTGMQCELGSVATPFEHRPYGLELSLCQRYYYRIEAGSGGIYGSGFAASTTATFNGINFPTSLRIAPSAIETTGIATDYHIRNLGATTVCSAVPTFSSTTISSAMCGGTVASGLTAGNGLLLRGNSAGSFLAWSAEL